MQIHLDTTTGNIINTYNLDSVTVNDEVYTDTIVLSPLAITRHPNTPEPTEALFESVVALASDNNAVVLLGYGAKSPTIKREWLQYFAQHQQVIEIMSFPAACRTYNVLLSDGRPTIAILIL